MRKVPSTWRVVPLAEAKVGEAVVRTGRSEEQDLKMAGMYRA
jgi:hypothetical protein